MTFAEFEDGTGPVLFAAAQRFYVGTSLLRWNGTWWTEDPVTVNGNIFALTSFDDGSGLALYVGGNFTLVNGTSMNGIIRWDGAAWSSVGGGFSSPTLGTIKALEVWDDGTGPALYAGGSFTQIGGRSISNLARWNGASWSAVGGSATLMGSVESLAVHDDGSGPALYIGGTVSNPTIAGAVLVMRWNGVSWSSLDLGLGLSGSVFSLQSADLGNGPQLFAGGSFGPGSKPSGHLASWNGSGWVMIPPGPQSRVLDLESFDAGSGPELYATGVYTNTTGSAPEFVRRWNGVVWSSLGNVGVTPLFGGTVQTVQALHVFDDGSGSALFVGGSFMSAGVGGTSRVARWGPCLGQRPAVGAIAVAGQGLSLTNAGLIPGHEYFNLFGLVVCSGAPGSGPILGLCASSPAQLAFLAAQAVLPVQSPPIHFTAQSSRILWGTFPFSPIPLEAICVDVTGGSINALSTVFRIAVP